MSVRGAGEPRRPSGYFFLTPVWGLSYTRLYIDTVIPSQLAEGNLPAFRGEPGNRYIIYTRPEDAELIRSSAVYEQINACVPVTFEYITDKINVVHDMMTDCFRRGIKAAEQTGAAVLFLTPDIVLSDGSFATLKRLSETGHDVVYIPAIRTMKTAVAATLEQSFKHGVSIRIQPAQLMRVALDNLHPLGDSSWWEEGEGGLIPANIYWRVDDDGLVGRCFHLHPILVHSRRKNATFFGTVDDDFVSAACPDASKDYVVSDSDELLAIELSDPGRFFEMRAAKGSVSDAARWAEQFANARHRKLFKATIRMHTAISDPTKWTAAEERASVVAEQIEARLNLPTWRLLSNADLLVRRCMQYGKSSRLRFANRGATADAGPPAWKNAILGLIDQFAGLRTGVMQLIRRVAARIEGWSGLSYQSRVYRDLANVLPPSPDLVLVSNSPGRFYLAPLLTQLSSSFANGRYASVLRRAQVSFLERGEPIADGTKQAVILEIDARRTKEVAAYLQESRRILAAHGRLLVYLHTLTFTAAPGRRPVIALRDLIALLAPDLDVVATSQQGGAGSLLQLRLGSWLRGVMSRRLVVRWLLLIFGLPLLPLIAIAGGIVVAATTLLDSIDRSKRFPISSLVLAEKAADGD